MLRLKESSWLYKLPAVAITFSLTCFGFFIFRAQDLSDAFYIIGHLGDGMGDFLRAVFTLDVAWLRSSLSVIGVSQRELAIAILAIALMEAVHLVQRKGSVREMMSRQPVYVRWAAYYLILAGIVFFGAFNQSQQFIYFQF